MKVTFLGATGTVTGSKYLVEAADKRILVDCGLFQGLKQLRLRNWAPLPVDPASIDAVILTHAHLDHCGYLPLLVRNGYRGRVYCSAATRDLAVILLSDSGRLQEEEAAYANRHGFSKHQPALPLYTAADAERARAQFVQVATDEPVPLGAGVSFRLLPAGHMLGASLVRLEAEQRVLLFSGDLGRPNDLIMQAPRTPDRADYLVVESTYGNRRHPEVNAEGALAEVVNRTVHRGGTVVMPAFAVGRAQSLMYLLYRLKRSGGIPNVPVFLDSPMAVDATALYHRHRSEHRLSFEECEGLCHVAKIVNSPEESRWLDGQPMPKVILAGSGMATGGRVVHHIKALAPDPRNTIVFAGFQAAGTRGAAMVAGAPSVKIHGQYVPVRAEVAMLDALSAHADCEEILGWLGAFQGPPRRTFVTHGEPVAADALRLQIEERLRWPCQVPDYRESVVLDP